MDIYAWNVQLHNQLQKLSAENSHLREIKSRLEEKLKRAEELLNAAGYAVRNRDETIKNLQSQLQQESLRRTALTQEVESLKIRSDVQQTPSWVIPRKELVVRENEVLGQGGWGIVYKGTFRGDEVAVKQLHKLSPEHRVLFEREMNIMSHCRHPNLLLLIGATNDPELSPLLVTELLHCNLRKLMDKPHHHKGLELKYVNSLALDVAKGLCYLHGKTPPIIHRDVKSDNILLEKQGDFGKAKLSDYGTANFYSNNMTPNRGTQIYAAPETLSSNSQSPQMDIYSFGWVVYEMCTGKRPGPRNHIQEQLELVSSADLQELVYNCILNDPAQRPPMDQVTDFLKGLSNTSA